MKRRICTTIEPQDAEILRLNRWQVTDALEFAARIIEYCAGNDIFPDALLKEYVARKAMTGQMFQYLADKKLLQEYQQWQQARLNNGNI